MNKLVIFDTHCHLADEKYSQQNQEIGEIIYQAKKNGVSFILNVGYDKESNQKVIKQLTEFPSLFGALGIHPNSNEDLVVENLQWIEKQLVNKKIIVIGEIGLDYYRNFTPKEIQKYWFKEQLQLAKKYNLPVLLHLRSENKEAFNDAYEIILVCGISKGILHCFTGEWEIAKKFIDLGEFYISFAGNITYENGKWKEKWQEVINKIPLEKIVIETDAPYLSPEPLRGKINYPANIIYTLKKIAQVKQIDELEASEKIYRNTLQLFNLFV